LSDEVVASASMAEVEVGVRRWPISEERSKTLGRFCPKKTVER